MDVTVAICTWNRAALLDQTLARLRETRVPAGASWEVVVVDNDPAGSAAPVLARHAQLPGLRSFAEPERNIARARNRAVREASGRWLAFVDDDELAPNDYLRRAVASLDGQPELDGVGGPCRDFGGDAPRTCSRCSLASVRIAASSCAAEAASPSSLRAMAT